MILEDLLNNKTHLNGLFSFLNGDKEIYLVGGAIRDYLLGVQSHDLDFVMRGDVFRTARGAARAVNGKFFVLDENRGTARVIVMGMPRYVLDFSQMRGDSLIDDLSSRDFTINAMAVSVNHPEKIIDPLGGAQDLLDKSLRICSKKAFFDDPVRILRAIRFGFQFNLRIEKESLRQLKQAIPWLSGVSMERKRDEIFRILEEKHSFSAVGALKLLGVMGEIIPEFAELAKIPVQGFRNGWDFAIASLRNMESLNTIIQQKRLPEEAGNLLLALVNSELGIYREKLDSYFSKTLADERKLMSLLKFASLYSVFTTQDFNKYQTVNGFIQIFSDPKKLAGYFLQQFALSLPESRKLAAILLSLAVLEEYSSQILAQDRRSIYRYYKLTGLAGLETAYLKLAQGLASQSGNLSGMQWERWLDVLRVLCHAWFERFDEWIQPNRFLSGDDLQIMFGISPGMELGQVLGDLEESQAAGVIQSRDDAVIFVENWFINHNNKV